MERVGFGLHDKRFRLFACIDRLLEPVQIELGVIRRKLMHRLDAPIQLISSGFS